MIGIGIGIGILVFDFLLFWKTKWFMPVFIVAGSIAWGQIWIDFFIEGQKQKEIEWLGARIKNIESMAERSASGLSEESGVLILEITSGGLAEQAGLEKGDVILSCENTAVKTMQDLLQSHQGNNWKGRLELRIFRNQTELTKSIKTK